MEHFFLYKFIYVVLKRPDSNFLLIIPAVIVYFTVLENGVFRLFCTYFFAFMKSLCFTGLKVQNDSFT